MKHILNNISEVEKRAIREQHEGGMKIDTSRFRKLMESKLGNSKPLVSEQGSMYSDFDLGRMRSGEDTTYTPYKGGDLRTDIMKMIHNSNSPNEDIIRTLRTIADEMESSGKLKKDVRDRFTDFESSISEGHSRRKSLMEQSTDENWSKIKKGLISFNNPKVINFSSDGKPITSLNWGNHSEAGRKKKWGISISSENPEIKFGTKDEETARMYKMETGRQPETSGEYYTDFYKIDYNDPSNVISTLKTLITTLG